MEAHKLYLSSILQKVCADEPAQRPREASSASRSVPILEAVGHQLSFGQVVEPSQLPAAVSAGVERREALIAPLQLHT